MCRFRNPNDASFSILFPDIWFNFQWALPLLWPLTLSYFINHTLPSLQYFPYTSPSHFWFIFFKLVFFPVGGGTSGAVFASRLAEEEDKTILLLEAGGDPTNDPNINIPIFADSVRGTEFDWQYRTVPQKDACKGHIDGVRRKSIKYISINIGPYLVLIWSNLMQFYHSWSDQR